MGQVSGIATISLRFLLVSTPLVAALWLATRLRGGAHFDTIQRIVCGAMAGLTSATFAGGIVFALRGTDLPLGGAFGDAGTFAEWADAVKRGAPTSSVYPPLQIHILAWVSDLTGMTTIHANKVFQIAGAALYGPAAYAAWRLLMRPAWALGLAVVTSMILIEPYRPCAGLVLIVLIPILIKFLDVLRGVGDLSLQRVMQYAAIFGVGLGLLCLLYSGWYQWSAPGFLVATLVVFPWRDWRRGALFCGIAGVLFGLCVLQYVMGFKAGSGIQDGWFSVDALMDPMYFAMGPRLPDNFRWMPLGEFGGIGVFTLILFAGLAIALVHGRRSTSVILLVALAGGCWAFRLWHAHNMWTTKLVQLWPRTSHELLCCLLALCVIAVYLLVQRTDPTSPWRSPSASAGVAAGLVLVIMSASSSTTDMYLPTDAQGTYGDLAWIAHNMSRKRKAISRKAQIVPSSSIETETFSTRALNDGDLKTFFSSAAGITENHEETIEIRWESPQIFSRLILFPARDGFPVDFALEVWDGSKWLTRREVTSADAPRDFKAMLLTNFGAEITTRFRLRATRLRKASDSNDYVLRLGEIELR
jgi:galactan 5-O-arabinofuranosyltransferase